MLKVKYQHSVLPWFYLTSGTLCFISSIFVTNCHTYVNGNKNVLWLFEIQCLMQANAVFSS